VGDLHRLIAFDLDGTLIDSRRDLADSANALVAELGGTPLSEEAIGRMVGEGAALLVRRTVQAAGIRIPDLSSTLRRFLEIYSANLLNHTRLYDGIADVVRRARTRARVTVLTNKPLEPTERILEGLGVRELFDEVVGGDSALPRKPDPSALFAMMRSAESSPEHTLLVGDSAVDLETANRAGARCCLVSFGFGFQNLPRERLSGREWIAADAAALSDVIEEFVRGVRL
jgi:phosphoglycolate phosphatase